MTNPTQTVRTAIVFGAGITPERVEALLPQRYAVIDADRTGRDGDSVIIQGTDRLGWTLEDYVVPRLASAGYFATEVDTDVADIGNGGR